MQNAAALLLPSACLDQQSEGVDGAPGPKELLCTSPNACWVEAWAATAPVGSTSHLGGREITITQHAKKSIKATHMYTGGVPDGVQIHINKLRIHTIPLAYQQFERPYSLLHAHKAALHPCQQKLHVQHHLLCINIS